MYQPVALLRHTLATIELTERVNLDALEQLKNTVREVAPHEATRFLNYAAGVSLVDGTVQVSYARPGKVTYGRLQPSASFQAFSDKIRVPLARGIYHDIDVVNCHPTILLGLCRKHDWPHTELQHYVTSRRSFFADIIDASGCTEKDAKRLVISLFYGGTFDAWCDGINRPNAPCPGRLKRFAAELASTAKLVYDQYSHVAVEKLYSRMSLVLQTYEHDILLCMADYFRQAGYTPGLYIHDGLMLYRKQDGPLDPSLLRECELYVLQRINWDICLTEKAER
jgi:hypothetical protein